MTPHACLAQEITEFLTNYGLDPKVAREITFLVMTDNEPAAEGLAEVLATRGFGCEIEPTDEEFWLVHARFQCVPEHETLKRLCQRFIAVAEEFECDIDGFRVQAEELLERDASSIHSAMSLDRADAPNAEPLGPIIQELLDMGIDETELFDEIGAISKACPAITRMARLHQGIELYREHQYRAAYDMFQQLCEETPREQRALFPLMAFCQFHLQEFEQAASLFQWALALRVGSHEDDAIDRLELTVHLGACLSRLGRFEEEADLYVQVLCEDPRHPTAHYNLACHASARGEFDRSLMHLREALVADPTLMGRAREDADLSAVRLTSEFRALLGSP